MKTLQEKVSVRFIGRKAPWTDNLYGTNLTFEKDQVRAVPADIAKKFLKHGDCFERADAPETTETTTKKVADPAMPILLGSNVHESLIAIKGNDVPLGDVVAFAFMVSELTAEEWNALEQDDRNARLDAAIDFAVNQDDTDAVLANTQQEQAKKQEEQNLVDDLRSQVMAINDKQALADLAMTRWQQQLNKSKSVANLQQQVLQYIDQFGIV